MTVPPLRNGMWVAACDGNKALLFENTGDATYPKLETREVLSQDNPPDRMQSTDAPGRVFDLSSGRRSAMEETNFHDQAEANFLRTFAKCLDRYVNERRISHLILIAPARALGILRPLLSDSTQRVIVATLDKEYVRMPAYEIERQLQRQK